MPIITSPRNRPRNTPPLDIQIREIEQLRVINYVARPRRAERGPGRKKSRRRDTQDAGPADVVDLCGELEAAPRAAVKYPPGRQKRRRPPILYTNKGVNPLVDWRPPPPPRTRHGPAIY